MGGRKWGWKDAGKGASGSRRQGRATGREVWWSAVREEEGRKKNKEIK